MAARLNIVGDVAIDGSDTPAHIGAQVIVRHEVATVSRSGEVLATRGGVIAVEQPEARSWLIRFDDGTAWAAKAPARKQGGCGCS